MTDYPIQIFYSEEDGGYIAEIPDLPHCSAFGKTQEEALAELKIARDLWLSTAHDTHRPVPEPRSGPATT